MILTHRLARPGSWLQDSTFCFLMPAIHLPVQIKAIPSPPKVPFDAYRSYVRLVSLLSRKARRLARYGAGLLRG